METQSDDTDYNLLWHHFFQYFPSKRSTPSVFAPYVVFGAPEADGVNVNKSTGSYIFMLYMFKVIIWKVFI